MLQYIYTNFNSNLITATVYFYLSKAFDSIDHALLLLKLESTGITGNCLNYLKYLSNRTQNCLVNNIVSPPELIEYGVTQGSTFGPLFFYFFTNDIANYITNVKISLYADDTAFYLSGPDNNLLVKELSLAASQILHGLQIIQNRALRVIYHKKQWNGTENAHNAASCYCLYHKKTWTVWNMPTNYPITQIIPWKGMIGPYSRSTTKTYLKTVLARNSKYERSFVHQSARKLNILSEEHKAIRIFTHFKTWTKTELMLGNFNFPE